MTLATGFAAHWLPRRCLLVWPAGGWHRSWAEASTCSGIQLLPVTNQCQKSATTGRWEALGKGACMPVFQSPPCQHLTDRSHTQPWVSSRSLAAWYPLARMSSSFPLPAHFMCRLSVSGTPQVPFWSPAHASSVPALCKAPSSPHLLTQ